MDLDLGRMQARLGGEPPGQQLAVAGAASEDAGVLRLRIGVGRPGAAIRPVSDWVLSPFEPEADVGAVGRAAEPWRRWCVMGWRKPSSASTSASSLAAHRVHHARVFRRYARKRVEAWGGPG